MSHSTDAPATPDAPWKPRSMLLGTLLSNRYRVTSLLGQGSTGAVYRADDVLLHRPVTVRILVPALAQQPPLIARIRARIELLTTRDQEAIVNLVDFTDVGMTLEGEVFVVTDFLDGDHLATMLTRGGRLPWARARTLLIRIAQILHGLHEQGIVVGTLEARHCYAVRTPAKQQAIKIVHNAILEHIASTIGPHAGHGAAMLARYVAPEQACGEPTDARTDVYSFGVIAYELLTGKLPFTDANPIRLVSMHLQKPPPSPRVAAPEAAIPLEVEALLLKCLAKDPRDRFSSMEALTEALTAVAESATDTATNVAATTAATAATAFPIAAPPLPDAAALEIPPTPSATTTASTPADPTPATTATPADPTPAPLAAATTTLTAPTPAAVATARPATLPPVLGASLNEHGRLRLPPPPSLDRPPTLFPRSSTGPLPVGTPTPVPRPPTLGMSTISRPPTLPPTGASILRPPSIPAPAAAHAPPTAPVPSTIPTPPVATAAPEAAPGAAAETAPVSSTSLDATPAPVPSTSLDATPAPAPSTSLAAAQPTGETSPGEGKVTDSARIRTRIAAYAEDEQRRKIMMPPAKAATAATSSPEPASSPPATPAPAAPVAPAPIIAAVAAPVAPAPHLRVVPPPERTLTPALTPAANDNLDDEPAPRRTGWLVGGIVGLVAAAGIAALVLTSPSFTAQRTETPPTKLVSAKGELPVPARSTPTKIAEATPADPSTDRGAAVALPTDTPPDPPTDSPPAEALVPPDTPPAEAVPPPADAVPDKPTSTKKKDPKKKRRQRSPEDEEPREKDVFDQLREHMAAKKAQEAAYAAAASAPKPNPPPAPAQPPAQPKSDADKARETLDRARQASSAGNPSLAYSLAKQSYNLNKTQEALELMGIAACRARNADNARSALGSLSGSRRNAVVSACSQNGITL